MQSLWKTVWKFPKKLKIELSIDPAIPTLGIYLKEMKTQTQKDMCTHVHCHVIYSSQDVEIMCPSVDEWLRKM